MRFCVFNACYCTQVCVYVFAHTEIYINKYIHVHMLLSSTICIQCHASAVVPSQCCVSFTSWYALTGTWRWCVARRMIEQKWWNWPVQTSTRVCTHVCHYLQLHVYHHLQVHVLDLVANRGQMPQMQMLTWCSPHTHDYTHHQQKLTPIEGADERSRQCDHPESHVHSPRSSFSWNSAAAAAGCSPTVRRSPSQ